MNRLLVAATLLLAGVTGLHAEQYDILISGAKVRASAEGDPPLIS